MLTSRVPSLTSLEHPARRQHRTSHIFGNQQHQTTESRIGNPDRSRLSELLSTVPVPSLALLGT
jgi:hypothetical protein